MIVHILRQRTIGAERLHRAVLPLSRFWRQEASHYPQPLSPLSCSTLLPAFNAGIKHVFDEFGLRAKTLALPRSAAGCTTARRCSAGKAVVLPHLG